MYSLNTQSNSSSAVNAVENKVELVPLNCSEVQGLSRIFWKYSSKVQVPQKCT